MDSPVVWKRARFRIRRRWKSQVFAFPCGVSEDRRGQMKVGQRVVQVVRNVDIEVEDVGATRES